MKTIKFFIALSLVFTSIPLNAKVIALGSPDKLEDFKSYLVNNPSYTSLSYYIINKKLSNDDELINEKYKLAVKGLVLKDLKPSIFLFKEITELPYESYIFTDNKIKLISESFYRLANLDRSNEDFWIKQGVLFNPDYKPSNEVFNPLIMKKYANETTVLSSYFFKLDIDNIKPKWSRVYLNGFEANGLVSIHPSSSYKLLFYKEGANTLQKKLTGAELIKLKQPSLTNYDLGSCKSPKFHLSGVSAKIDAVFYSKNCIVKKEDQNFLAKNSTNPYLKYDLKKSADPVSYEKVTVKKDSVFSNKKTWYYIIGGVVLTSLAIGLSQSNDTKVRPVQYD